MDMNDTVRTSPTEMRLVDKNEELRLKNAVHGDCCE